MRWANKCVFFLEIPEKPERYANPGSLENPARTRSGILSAVTAKKEATPTKSGIISRTIDIEKSRHSMPEREERRSRLIIGTKEESKRKSPTLRERGGWIFGLMDKEGGAGSWENTKNQKEVF